MSAFISDSWADIDDTPTISVDDNATGVTQKVEEPAPPTNVVEKKTLDLEAPQPKATDVTPSELGKTAILPEETKETPPAEEEPDAPKAPAPITIDDLLNEPSEFFRIFVTGVDVGKKTAKRDVEDVIGNFFLSKGTIPIDVKVPLAATAEKPDDWRLPDHYNSMAVVWFVHPEDVEKALKGNDEWKMSPLKRMSIVEVPREGNAAYLLKEKETLATRLLALQATGTRDGMAGEAGGLGRSFAALAPESRPQETEQKPRKNRKNREKKGGSGRTRSEKKKDTSKTPPAPKAANAPVKAVTDDGFAVAGGAKAARVHQSAEKIAEDKIKGSTPVNLFDALGDDL